VNANVIRFWSKVNKTNGCWLWLAGKHSYGYGLFYSDGKCVRAHRFAWESVYGPIPDGLFVLHECDNPPCVNPAHLFLGTKRDNRLDCIIKGRNPKTLNYTKGPKLTREMAMCLRERYLLGGVTITDLAVESGISQAHASAIIGGGAWASTTVVVDPKCGNT